MRGTETAAAAPPLAPGDDDEQGAERIADYDRRRPPADVMPADAPDDDFPTLIMPADVPDDDFPTLVMLAVAVIEDDFPTLAFPRVSDATMAALASDQGDAAMVPRLAAGVELIGEYQGSGLTTATYLVRNPEGRVVQLSRLLYLLLSGVDGNRTQGEIAERVGAAFGRTVSAGNVEYLLANKLAPLGLIAAGEGAGETRAVHPDPMILTLKLRRTLIPPAGVQLVARLLAPLFSPPVVVVVLASLAGVDVWLVRSGRMLPAFRDVLVHPLLLLVVMGLTLGSALFHECGHAAACRYGGARPGRIGAGLYVMWPALFTNVTDSYRLGRGGRIRVDLGGVYFNAIFAVAMAAAYRVTGYLPLLAAVLFTELEAAEQLIPSLRFDGYFILTDLLGVPDLWQRVAPVLASLIPGRPADPRVGGLRRGARVALTAWVLVMVPLLAGELVLIIVAIPLLAGTFARSMTAQADAVVTQFSRGEVAAGLVSVISVLLLAFPVIGICYVLVLIGRLSLRRAAAAARKHPALWVPMTATVLLAAAALAAHWGLLRLPGHPATAQPGPAAAGSPAAGSPAAGSPAAGSRGASSRATTAPSPTRTARPRHPVVLAGGVLTPASAHGFDALASPGSDPGDENDDEAQYAIDGNPATAWSTQYYLGSPYFGGLKKGTGLILDMGRTVRLSSVTITLGPARGADVAIEVGDNDTLAAATLSTFTTVATADDIGGTFTFTTVSPASGRYVLIWFTKLPPYGSGQYAAQIYNIVIRGTR
jgi:putative peptide zinc metalloprotease protein